MQKLTCLLLVFIALACSDQRQSIDTRSSVFSNKTEKMAFLKNYFQLKTNIRDTEYHIKIQDNSGGIVPGPSYSSYQIALKLDPSDLDRWVDTSKEIPPYELPDWSHILPATASWDISGEKRFFQRGYVWIEKNNILLYTHSTD